MGAGFAQCDGAILRKGDDVAGVFVAIGCCLLHLGDVVWGVAAAAAPRSSAGAPMPGSVEFARAPMLVWLGFHSVCGFASHCAEVMCQLMLKVQAFGANCVSKRVSGLG